MIVFDLGADTLGNTRFAFSPLAEATLSLRLLGQPRPMHIHAPWIRQARTALEGVDLELLQAVVPAGPWIASFLVTPTRTTQPAIEEQLAELSHLDPAVLAADLGQVWSSRPAPRRVQELIAAGARGPGQLAETLWDYWDAALRPFWTRMCAVLEDDVSYRVAGLVQGGLYDLLGELHPEITVQGDQVLIDKPHHAGCVRTASEMTLTPAIFGWPGLVLEDGEMGRFGLTYPARGAARVWETPSDDARAGDHLGRLLGRTRSAILHSTEIPRSTTQIAGELGQSPASVNAHLAVLRDNGLVTSRRSGRSVLYRQTPLAATIIGTQRSADESARQPGG